MHVQTSNSESQNYKKPEEGLNRSAQMQKDMMEFFRKANNMSEPLPRMI